MTRHGDLVCGLMLFIACIYYGHYAIAGLSVFIGFIVNLITRRNK